MGFLLLLPVVLIGAAALVSYTFVRMSTLRLTRDAAVIRNYPQAQMSIDLARIDRFVPAAPAGTFAFLRPATAVLVLTDGSKVAVRCIHEPEAGSGVDALNERVAVLRQGS